MIKLLIVDDSSLVRMVLRNGLSQHPEINVMGVAPNPFIAREMIIKEKPDVITLDVEMPEMDGLEFLRRLMPAFPIPTIIVSSLSKRGSQIALDALDFGAVDVVTKPDAALQKGLDLIMGDLTRKVLNAAKVDVSSWKGKIIQASKHRPISSNALPVTTDKVIAIGASTGGTVAIKEVIPLLPVNSPGVVLTQHMPPVFTERLANSLNTLTPLHVKEAEAGDKVAPGTVLIAPGGDQHMIIKRVGGFYKVFFVDGTPDEINIPSVDRLFDSVAQHAGKNAVGVIMTGMGKDGAKGLLNMKNAGAFTIGQDEKSCVVYGMPMAAHELGAVNVQVPLNHIAENIVNALKRK